MRDTDQDGPPRSNIHRLRMNIVVGNFSLIAATTIFFVASPMFGFPGGFQFGYELLQISFPVLVGYLSFAASFAGSGGGGAARVDDFDPQQVSLLAALAYGSMVLYFLISLLSCVVFWVSQWGDGVEFKPDLLKLLLSSALGICTGVCNHVIARLFPSSVRNKGGKP